MTNWEKIEPTLKQLFSSITIDELANSLEYGMGCCDCTQFESCRKNKNPCYQNLIDWLAKDETDAVSH